VVGLANLDRRVAAAKVDHRAVRGEQFERWTSASSSSTPANNDESQRFSIECRALVAISG